jgi:prepilin-type N-terminal cleavage/methylation domain-containing protein
MITRYRNLPAASCQLQAGFSLIEIIITIAIFLILSGGIYFSYANVLEVISHTRTRTLAITLLNKQVEYVRNLKFDDVGIVGGYPVGLIPATQTVSYEGQQFALSAFVRNVDDVFDGQATGTTPTDTAPADYRLVEFQATCPTCYNFAPVSITTWAAPQNLESSTKNGSLFVLVFDANGQPITNADVLVKNTALSPTITINDSTGNDGYLRLIDIPTSTSAYQVTVSKSGYSSSKTYAPGDVANPNPTQPHATIASQQVSSVSLSIDRVSQIDVVTHDQYCSVVPSFDFTQHGAKLIGTGPNVLKYSKTFTTDSNGLAARTSLEWDTYSFIGTDAAFDIAGSNPLVPLSINPNTSTTLSFLVEPTASSSLLATIVGVDGSPLAGASVSLSKSGFAAEAITGQKSMTKTDWKGTSYTSQDGNIDTESVAGQLTLTGGGTYPTSTNSYFISGTLDFGTAAISYHSFSWSPTSQPSNTSLQFQLAASNNSTGPFSFTGPDGTSSSYYTSSSTLPTIYNNNRYVQYKAFLNTTDSTVTPRLEDLTIVFSSSCIPSGQAFFSNIPTGSYTLTASKTGFTTASSSVTVGTGWQEARLIVQ